MILFCSCFSLENLSRKPRLIKSTLLQDGRPRSMHEIVLNYKASELLLRTMGFFFFLGLWNVGELVYIRPKTGHGLLPCLIYVCIYVWVNYGICYYLVTACQFVLGMSKCFCPVLFCPMLVFFIYPSQGGGHNSLYIFYYSQNICFSSPINIKATSLTMKKCLKSASTRLDLLVSNGFFSP